MVLHKSAQLAEVDRPITVNVDRCEKPRNGLSIESSGRESSRGAAECVLELVVLDAAAAIAVNAAEEERKRGASLSVRRGEKALRQLRQLSGPELPPVETRFGDRLGHRTAARLTGLFELSKALAVVEDAELVDRDATVAVGVEERKDGARGLAQLAVPRRRRRAAPSMLCGGGHQMRVAAHELLLGDRTVGVAVHAVKHVGGNDRPAAELLSERSGGDEAEGARAAQPTQRFARRGRLGDVVRSNVVRRGPERLVREVRRLEHSVDDGRVGFNDAMMARGSARLLLLRAPLSRRRVAALRREPRVGLLDDVGAVAVLLLPR